MANSIAGLTGWKLSSRSLEKTTGLKTASGLGVMVDSNWVSSAMGIEGVLVIDGVSVMVGVREMVGVRVMVGVWVMVGVEVTVGEGGKNR